MPLSFLQRLFQKQKRSANQPSLPGTSPGVGPKEDPSLQAPRQGELSVESIAKTRSLFAFVDLKDPFTLSEIAGEDVPGPILSILSAKSFDSVLLFHTPQTRSQAMATMAEIGRRHRACRVRIQELPVSDPKNYSSLMGSVWRYGHDLSQKSGADEKYVCVSSGTAEMRAVWFQLTSLGIVKAKLLQLGTPANPLFGKANVKEFRADAADWQTIHDLALPAEAFREDPRELLTRSLVQVGPTARWTPFSWLRRRQKAEDETASGKLDSHSEVFEEEFLGQMRRKYGERLRKPELAALRVLARDEYRRLKAKSPQMMNYIGQVRILAHEFFTRYCAQQSRASLLETPRSRYAPSDLEGPWGQGSPLRTDNSVPVELLRREAGSSTVNQPTEELRAFPLTREQRKTLGQMKRSLPDRAAAEGPSNEPPDTTDALREDPYIEETAGEGATEGEEETAGEEEPDPLGIPVEGAPDTQTSQIGPENLPVVGLNHALKELGIHVGSAILRHAAERAGIAADSHLPVLLLGETGTGKERFAQLIHRLSPRCGKDMVIVNCAAIPAPLAESYLFGHVKGAFSDATYDKEGIFENADETTLFLDEIAELTPEVQAKLLRVIEEGIVQRLGNHKPRKVDVRIIAATNRDLPKEISAGRFRQDLYFRLEVVQIKLPPLRLRRSEIPELALALLRQINQRRQKPRQLTTGALRRLEHHLWPGNVRELSNVLERSVLYSRGDLIDSDDLFIDGDAAQPPILALPEPREGFSIEDYLAQVRKQVILRALELCNGNQAQAAAILGISKQAVNKFVNGQSDNDN